MADNTTARRNLASLKDFAGQCGVTERTVRQWIAQGRIQAYRLGDRLIRIDLDEAEQALLTPIPTGWNAA